MVKDPVTGAGNTNTKKPKTKQKATKKVSRPNIFNELRPLDNFDSKLLAKNRLSVLLLSAIWLIIARHK